MLLGAWSGGSLMASKSKNEKNDKQDRR